MWKTISVTYHISKIMEKMYMNLPTNVGKHLTKFIIHFMIKILSKLGLEENFFRLIKGIYKKQITYTHTQSWVLTSFSVVKYWNPSSYFSMWEILSNAIIHGRNKKHKDCKGQNKIGFVHQWYYYLQDNPKESTKNKKK